MPTKKRPFYYHRRGNRQSNSCQDFWSLFHGRVTHRRFVHEARSTLRVGRLVVHHYSPGGYALMYDRKRLSLQLGGVFKVMFGGTGFARQDKTMLVLWHGVPLTTADVASLFIVRWRDGVA